MMHEVASLLTRASHNPEKNYRQILSQERAWARSVAASAIKKRPFTVWEVMIPVLLIISFTKTKGDREVFVKNLVFTKELALKAALEIAETGKTKREAMIPIRETTRELLTTVDPSLYSEDIRQCQMQEMDLLVDHYSRLLKVDGEDFPALIKAAYPDRKQYLAFLKRLGDIERQVNGAALKTLGPRGDRALVSRMEKAMKGLRMASAERIFGAD